MFVGGPQQARGRTFRVVFVPGLAERTFPQHPHEDPLMLDDEMRGPLHADLLDQQARLRTERLLLRLAVGAPTERLWTNLRGEERVASAVLRDGRWVPADPPDGHWRTFGPDGAEDTPVGRHHVRDTGTERPGRELTSCLWRLP